VIDLSHLTDAAMDGCGQAAYSLGLSREVVWLGVLVNGGLLVDI
jgi:hypothetical protein